MQIRLSVLAALVPLALALAPPAAAQQSGSAVCRTAPEIAGRYQPLIVHFDSGKSALRDADRQKIAEMARTAKASKIQQICIRGFTDKQGDPEANRQLSMARAEAVAAEFGRHGITRDYLALSSGGEPGGSLFGGMQSKSEADRRVEIRIAR